MVHVKPGQNIAKVAAIVGGYSREQWLDSSPWIIATLKELGLEVATFELTDPMLAPRLLDFRPDVVWPMGLGEYAEDGRLQGFIETLLPETPFVGSGVTASAVGMDKELTQEVCQALGLGIPKSICFQAQWHPHGRTCRVSKPGDAAYITPDAQPNYERLRACLGTPLVVKPLRGGASLDLALVSTTEDFEAAFIEASRFGPVLVQAHVPGREFSVCILETAPGPLPICQMLSGDLYDTTSKLNRASHWIDPPIGDELTAHLQQTARALHDHLGCHGFSRTDLKVAPDGRLIVLEINTNPGLIPDLSIFPSVCAAAGISYPHLIRQLLLSALAPRHRTGARLCAADAAPFPAHLRTLLPSLPEELQPPIYRSVQRAPDAQTQPVMASQRHCC